MDKYAYEKPLNKHFQGNYIELQTAGTDEVTLIPLDAPEKVKDYNSGGGYYLNHPLYKGSKVYKLVPKKAVKKTKIRKNKLPIFYSLYEFIHNRVRNNISVVHTSVSCTM